VVEAATAEATALETTVLEATVLEATAEGRAAGCSPRYVGGDEGSEPRGPQALDVHRFVADDRGHRMGGCTMGTVLIGIDGSADSRAALRFGATLARSIGADLHALWAWQYPSDTVATIGRVQLPDRETADELFREQLEQVVEQELGDDVERVRLEVARGPAVTALRQHAKGTEADVEMIVVGSRGLGGFRGLMLGSVSQQLTEHAPRPVTIVRRDALPLHPKLQRIMIGHDGSAHAAAAMHFVRDLALRAGSEVVVAYATPTRGAIDEHDADEVVAPHGLYETVDGWCEPLRETGLDPRIVVLDGELRDALLDAAHDHNADLLAVGTRGHGAIARLLIGSVAASVVRHNDIPVTVIPKAR
jgi:nucleotide-binding universal stress UspA family protein